MFKNSPKFTYLMMADSQCPICLRVYIEPVVLPCEHCLCKPCFDGVIKQSSLQCPLCRRRIGSWARLSARRGTLVDKTKWDYMQNHHREEVRARLSGQATPKKQVQDRDSTMREQLAVVLANTGEIRREYELELIKVKQERAEQDLASEKLIKEIIAQDVKELAAFKAANKENKPAVVGEQSTKLPLPRRSSSIDSITGEYSRHFKPIVRYPRTPPRPTDKNKGYPETIKVTPCPQTVKRLDFASSCSPPEVSSSNDSCKAVIFPSKVSEELSAPSCSQQKTDHTFLLPLQGGMCSTDDHSNDGLSLVSSSTGTSISNSRIRIEMTSPIIPFSPGGLSNHRRTRSMGLSVSDGWSPSSSESRTNRCRQSKRNKVNTKNGYLNTKSSRILTNGHANGYANGPNAAQGANGAQSSNAVSGEGSRSKVSRSRVSRSSSAKTTISYRSTEPEWSPVTISNDFTDTNGDITTTTTTNGITNTNGNTNNGDVDKISTNGGTVITNKHVGEPAFIDPDEIYAKNLQDMFEMEKKYNLTAIRFSGSGNEYNTRKRRRKNT